MVKTTAVQGMVKGVLVAIGLLVVGVLVGVGVEDGETVFVVVGVSVGTVVSVAVKEFVGSSAFNSSRVLVGGINVILSNVCKVDIGSRPAISDGIGIAVSFMLLVIVLYIRKSERQQQLRAIIRTRMVNIFAVVPDFQ